MEKSGVELNEATLVTTLSACVSLGDLEVGKKDADLREYPHSSSCQSNSHENQRVIKGSKKSIWKKWVDSEALVVGRAAIGNLLGGIGYFYGQSKISIPKGFSTLSSGFDDYPRASHPSDDERHLDLRCWMLLAANCMHSIAEFLGANGGLEKMHLDDVSGAYFDFGNHTEKASSILGKQMDHISNRSTLWTDHGLRSLSRTSSLYMKRNTEHDPPYWRGPIWINMNYMILSALHHYSQEDGPYKIRVKAIYDELRSNLMRNIVRNYYETGFLWGAV
ncbi:hypothetical protein J5N97_020578 [Dioscorea zingiberensis]|uniref:Glycosyl hydrolase family 63 C-terminal domain-containing protein n=1 Tax=Dioscorea zingiberensis TaxID=325984 RepID=A0A9D5HDK1_9LILI|nr:hypothetical protein J5N97_020578 [Dioscorea zingiberensis]